MPPPYGGVSVHIERLAEYLNLQGHQCSVVDVLKKEGDVKDYVLLMDRYRALSFLFRHPRCIVHMHDFGFEDFGSKLYITLRLFGLLMKKHFFILSFHDERFLERLNNYVETSRRIIAAHFNSYRKVIVDNPDCRELAACFIKNHDRIAVVPEFIAPPVIPPIENTAVNRLRHEHRFLLTSNAWKICFHNRQDLYGIDMLIELMNRLVNEHSIDVALAFLLPQIEEREYFEKLNRRISELGLTERFIFITEPLKVGASLWALGDIFVRATNTDGNSVGLMEALSLGIPVIASDCSPRPEGTVLFQTRNNNDLLEKTLSILDNIDNARKKVKALKIPDAGKAILDIYRHLP